ncbi:MAG TPA: EAL domain-containing protein [Thermoanaerobaculia bacterium]|nr:EAL domain-containing protein [Thermoanaerobaculia bacterium]
MSDGEQIDVQELAMLVRRLDRQRRAKQAADAISEHATGGVYDKQQHLRLLQSVAIAANESRSLDDSLQAAVDQICAQLGWPVGHAYLCIGTTSILTLSDIWYIADIDRFDRFRRAVETTLIAPSNSVAGGALRQRAPVSTNALDSVLPLPLAVAARDAGLQSALAFPVMGIDAPVAVLEFFSPEPIETPEMLLEVIRKIGDLLGKVHVRTLAGVTLRRSAEQYRLLFEGNANPMWIHDAGSLELIAVNDNVVSQFGYSREELLRMTVSDLQPQGDPAFTARDAGMHIVKKDGSVITAEISGYDLDLPGRRARITMAVDTDEGRRASEALRESERRFREMLDTIELAAVLLDIVGTVTYCNPFLLRLSGWAKDEVVGRNFFEVFLPEERRAAAARDFTSNVGRGAVAAHDESEIVVRGGERRVITWNNTILRNAEGSVLGTASIGSDVTEQRTAEHQLLYNAFHDSLTGLPNRALFLDRVEHALNRVRRDESQSFAVLLLDVDHFKNINDSLGHATGDRLLIAIGERLSRSVRAADTVARFGGDEFTILVEKAADAADVTRTAARVQEEIAAPFRIDDNDLFTSASIGIIVAGPEYESAEQIVRDADTAMYRAKAQGRARSEIFDATMRAEAVARLQVETDLRHAIERQELVVFYQPIVLLDSRAIVGYEALVRWQHPARGLVEPSDFIPLAEETGLVVPIGEFVLGAACAQAAKWAPRFVSVNISSRHFMHDLVADVRGALARSGLAPASLHIEVTESAIMEQPGIALDMMNELRALGCRLILDDFGTGYSSLSYLHRFPIDGLKIDASFVRAALLDRKNVEIIRSILALGAGLSIDVTAEGIESVEQLELMRTLGCAFGQGYCFARPAAP